MRLTLVGHDMAPSQCFANLMAELDVSEVSSFLGRGKPLNATYHELEDAIKSSTFVLLGMSSSPVFAMSELEAASIAIENNIPFGFYSDMALCPLRARNGAWFGGARHYAKLLTGLLPHDLTSTRLLFPNADIVPTGNPLRDAMAFPKLTKEEVRKSLGVGDDELLIIAPGGKFMMGNALIWLNLIEAMVSLDQKACIAFFAHPGDPTIRAIDSSTGKPLNLYGNLPEHTRVRTRFIDGATMSTMDAIVGADVVVEFTGSASVSAAYQRIPVVNVLPEIWMRVFKEESGEATIETVENGSALAVTQVDSSMIGTALWRVLENSGIRENLREAQERAYPLPSSPTASLDALVRVVKHYCA